MRCYDFFFLRDKCYNGGFCSVGFVLMQRCNLVEPLKHENGKPCIPLINSEQSIPSFLTSTNLKNPINKHDTRLRLFSGTANPALSQVTLHKLVMYSN